MIYDTQLEHVDEHTYTQHIFYYKNYTHTIEPTHTYTLKYYIHRIYLTNIYKINNTIQQQICEHKRHVSN